MFGKDGDNSYQRLKRNVFFMNFLFSTVFSACTFVANAAVFEQKIDGEIVAMTDGASADAPSGKDSLAVESSRRQISLTSVVMATEGREYNSRTTLKDDITSSAQAKPRPMTRSLSMEQIKYHQLAVEVAAAKYSGQSDVVRRQMDRQTFVALFTAMIQRESNFDPRAISRAGAKGLGQLMPGTAKDLGVCDVFVARDNLEGAVSYFTEMFDRFGSPELALAAYNAGPGAVMQHNGVPPYRETQQYIADIIHHAQRSTEIPELLAAMNFQPAPYQTSLQDVSAKNTSIRLRKHKCKTEV
ncbi:lytic transglycosylase domain-containing protein [Brucella sp. NBRC 12950]|uniref:lytic transglycosylase domain-containing protein n=1 Tax=Brucella sp. NBRC 12950 TaxID=2994518 RepID=UPI0025562AB7|nr:lytic transglycosylase domain-containing protein [Brucella sp. NBRC 12950]